MTAVQVGKESTDNAVVAAYMSRRSRWNWGFSGGRIPALVGGAQTTVRTTDADGNSVIVRTSDALQQIHRQAGGVIAYPFNRAQRIEGSVGIDSTVFDERTNTVTLSSAGQTIGDVTVHRPAAPVATTLTAGAAFVYDTAVFGVASPVLGERYRLAVSPSVGDLRFVTMSADYRRYVMPVKPFTIAVRAQAEARTGPDVADPRLLPLVWNMRDFVRGYDTDNVTVRTSRLAVANAELRFPIAALMGRPASAAMPFEGLRVRGLRQVLDSRKRKLRGAGAPGWENIDLRRRRRRARERRRPRLRVRRGPPPRPVRGRLAPRNQLPARILTR
jgi:hypothetical protein